MNTEEILDYNEYYTDEEQDAYDDGYYDGWRAGMLQGRIAAGIVLIASIIIFYLILS